MRRAARTNTEDLFLREIGKRLHRTRKVRGLTQIALAKLIGVQFRSVQRYECAASRISVFTLFRLAQALNVPPSYFLEHHKCPDLTQSENPSRQS